MDKREAAAVLEEIGVLLDLSGENLFRIRAYQNAARIVKSLPFSLEEAVRDGKLQDIKGIGPHLAERIAELVTGGRLEYLEELRSRFPKGVLEMLRIPGLGSRKIRVLVELLGIRSIGELEYACRENRLIDLPGFGAKTQEKILKGITGLSAYAGRFLAVNAAKEAAKILQSLKNTKGLSRLEIAGSLRRCRETVKDIDMVAAGESNSLMDALASNPLVDGVEARGGTKMTVRLLSGVNLDLRVVPTASFPYALQHFTGSREHNIALRGRAVSMGKRNFFSNFM